MITQYIPDVFAAVVARVSQTMEALPADPFKVFFDFGHYTEVTKNLTLKDQSPTQQDKRYPLVWLVMDFDEQMGANPADYARIPGVQIIIAVPTTIDYTMQERRDKNFIPTLYPIYAELIKQLAVAPEFGMPGELKLVHTKTDRPYWGGSDQLGNGTANLFNDFIDAIQIRNLSLNVKHKIC